MNAARYALEFTTVALKQLRKLDRTNARRIRSATEALRDTPRPRQAKVLAGHRGQLRIRVGDYRVVYTVEENRLTVLVVEIGHRREIYDRQR